MGRPRKEKKEVKEKKIKKEKREKKWFRIVSIVKATKEVQAHSIEEAFEAKGEISCEYNVQVDEL